jgi:general secretion pathway protein L
VSFLDIRRINAGGMVSKPALRWRAAADAALRWWFTELAGLVPTSVTARLFGQGALLPLRLDSDLLHIDGGPSFPIEASVLPPAVRARIAQADAVVLVLPATMVLRRNVDIPAAAARELASAVPFLVERHTPFPPDQARAAWRIRNRDLGGGAVRVELAVTASAALDRITARLHQLDVPVNHIHVEGDDRLPRLDFSASRTGRPMRSWLAEPWRPLLAGAFAVLLVGPVAVACVLHVRADILGRALAAHGDKPREEEVLRAAVRRQAALVSTLSAHTAAPGALDLLHQITQALPDSTWLFSFDFTGQAVQLGGFSTDLPAAVASLQSLPEVAHLEFRSPVIHDAHADRDRFDILLRLKKAGHAQRVSPQPGGGAGAAPGLDLARVGAGRGAEPGERGGGPH